MSNNNERSHDVDEYSELYEEYAEYADKVADTEGTATAHKKGVRFWLQWCEENNVHPFETSSNKVKQYLLSILNYADTTVSSRFTAVSEFYTWAEIFQDSVDQDPTEGVDISKNPFDVDASKAKYVSVRKQEGVESPKSLSKAKVEKLFEPVPSPQVRNELLIRLLWQTALRAEEIARVKIDKIDLNKREIRIRSAKLDEDHELYHRRVYYSQNLDWLMDQWIDSFRHALSTSANESPFLFVSRKAPRIKPNRVNDIVRTAAHNAGIQEAMYVDQAGKTRWLVTAHRLRHSAINYWANETDMNLVTIRRIAGHARLETTKNYIDASWEQVRSDYTVNAPG